VNLPAGKREHVLPLHHDAGGAQLLHDGQDLHQVVHLGWGPLDTNSGDLSNVKLGDLWNTKFVHVEYPV
jgi:hypothetical protein